MGGFLHADDIRTLATSAESLEAQVNLVKNFAAKHFLKLNGEVVVFARGHQTAAPVCEVEGSVLPVGDTGRCLGVWWKGDLMATKSIEENIRKARRAFFLLGSLGSFQGDLGPLSSRSVVETCVLPVLMYGCESWILSEGDLKLLEAFQGEMAKRILKLPKHFSNTAAVTTLDWPSMRARLLLRKLFFLKRVTDAQADTLVGGVVRAFSDELNHIFA